MYYSNMTGRRFLSPHLTSLLQLAATMVGPVMGRSQAGQRCQTELES